MAKLGHAFSTKEGAPEVGTTVQADCNQSFLVVGRLDRRPPLAQLCPGCKATLSDLPGIGMTTYFVEEEVDLLPGQRGTVSALGTFHIEGRFARPVPGVPTTPDEVLEKAREIRDGGKKGKVFRLLPPLAPKKKRD